MPAKRLRVRELSVRKIFLVNRSYVITLPSNFVNNYSHFVIRCVKDLAVITPEEKDYEMIMSGEIFDKLKEIKRLIEKEKELLLQIKHLESVYKQMPLDDIRYKIEDLKRQLDYLRLYYKKI